VSRQVVLHNPDLHNPDILGTGIMDETDETVILCRSADRRSKERAMHDKFSRRIEEALERLAARIARSKKRLDPAPLNRQIGRILRQNRAAARFTIALEPDQHPGRRPSRAAADNRLVVQMPFRLSRGFAPPSSNSGSVMRGRLSGNRLRKEESCQPKLGADILLEPTHSIEIMKDVTGDCKFLSDWDLKLEMASQEVISA
jgi:hypothetical protein